jgi:cyclic pyranopterin phosphate synthase
MTPSKKRFTHLDADNRAAMVDITNKDETKRAAMAQARVKMSPEAFEALLNQTIEKGDVLSVAQIAGISAAKKTSELIPLCHPLPLSQISVEFKLRREDHAVDVHSLAKADAKTGVEMEALVAAAVSALTIYDMCKAIDKSITITDLFLLEKTGGKSGTFKRKSAQHIP